MTATAEQPLRTYTIYRLPPDMVGQPFAVREFVIHAEGPIATDWVEPASCLESARRKVPPWADYRMDRSPDDDPTIVETWL